MHTRTEKSKENKGRAAANPVSQKTRETKRNPQFKDNTAAAVRQNKLKEIIQRGKGSHNKKQMLKIKSYVTMNTQTQVNTTHVVNDDYDLGFIQGHPQGFNDWGAYAMYKVGVEYHLGGETLVSVDYKTFSKK